MPDIDPWGGFNEGMRGLGQTFTDLSRGKQQEEINRMAKQEFDAKMADRAREQETKQGLASIYAQGKETTTVPGQSAAEVMNAPGYDLKQGLPSAVPEQQKPLYSPQEIQAKATEYMTSRGDWAGLKGVESAMDVTSKIDERSQKLLSNIFKTTKEMRASGFDNNAIKSALKSQADNLNRMSGKQVLDPAMIDTMDINKAGDLITQDIGGGQKAIMITQPNGSVTVHVVDTTKQSRVENTGRQLDQADRRLSQAEQRLQLAATNPVVAPAAKGLQKQLAEDVPRWTMASNTYGQLIESLDKNPDVAGFYGAMKSYFAPLIPGVDELEGPQAFQAIANAMRGQNRMAVIGPGAMSDYEGKILASVSGAGGKITPAAAKKLLEFWKANADKNISSFDDRVNNLAPYSEAGAEISKRPGVQVKPSGTPQNKVYGGKKPTKVPMTREMIGAIVKTEAGAMKAGTSRKADFNGRKGTISKDAQGNVTVRLD